MAERNNFSSFLDIVKGILTQIQNVYKEGPIINNRSASLDAFENLSVKIYEACDTRVVLLNNLINPKKIFYGRKYVNFFQIYNTIPGRGCYTIDVYSLLPCPKTNLFLTAQGILGLTETNRCTTYIFFFYRVWKVKTTRKQLIF